MGLEAHTTADLEVSATNLRISPKSPAYRTNEFFRILLRSGLLDLCGDDRGGGGGFGGGFAAEDSGGEESDDQADGQGLNEGVGHVDKGVLVELLRVLDGSDLRGGGGWVKS